MWRVYDQIDPGAIMNFGHEGIAILKLRIIFGAGVEHCVDIAPKNAFSLADCGTNLPSGDAANNQKVHITIRALLSPCIAAEDIGKLDLATEWFKHVPHYVCQSDSLPNDCLDVFVYWADWIEVIDNDIPDPLGRDDSGVSQVVQFAH